MNSNQTNFTEMAQKLIEKLDQKMSLSETSIKQAGGQRVPVKFRDVILSSFLENQSAPNISKHTLQKPHDYSRKLAEFKNAGHSFDSELVTDLNTESKSQHVDPTGEQGARII